MYFSAIDISTSLPEASLAAAIQIPVNIMPAFEFHCQESERLFGKRYEEAHFWMDEFAGSKECGMKHRKKRHHQSGIEEAVKLFGLEVRAAAKQHIISDLKEEGWTESDPFPKDELHYQKLGLF